LQTENANLCKGLSARTDPSKHTFAMSIHAVVRQGNEVSVRALLQSNRTLANARDGTSATPLMVASTLQDPAHAIAIMDVLLAFGAQLATRDNNRRHVLLHACAHGASPAIINRLVELGKTGARGGAFHWKHCDSERRDAFELAVRSGSTVLVKHLLNRVEAFSDYVALPDLWAAISANDTAMALVLFEAVEDDVFCDSRHEYGMYRDDDDDDDGRPQVSEVACANEAVRKSMWAVVERFEPKVLWQVQQRLAGETEPEPRLVSAAVAYEAVRMRQLMQTMVWPRIKYLALLRRRERLRDAFSSAARISDDAFRLVALFMLGSFDAKKELRAIYFQENAEYCGECESYHPPYECPFEYRHYGSD